MSELTDQLWDRFGGLGIDDLPAEVVRVAHHSILDWFGCAIAGSREPLSVILRDELTAGHGPCSIVATGLRADALRSAMVNGAAGHALDFDDTSPVMGGHPTAPLLPAALAVAERDGRGGADLVTAYVVGMEIQARIGAAIGPEHYAKGWHTTATIGVFGAAGATSWLLGLDHTEFGNAIGIAASNAAGLKANFGTMTKPLHPGLAAERGLLAAGLAAGGYSANSSAVDGNQGLAQAAGSGDFRSDVLSRWRDDWATPRTLFKHHAACHLTHAGIEATRSAVDGLSAGDIDTITLTVNPGILDVCGIPNPTTGLEAKFSLRGTQALTVHGMDTAAVATFEDGPINLPEIQAFLDRIVIETDPAMGAMAASVSVTTSSGATVVAAHDVSQPQTDLDHQGRRLRAKFLALATPILGLEPSERLADQLADLRTVSDAKGLMALACPA